jgi:hypothetical protein
MINLLIAVWFLIPLWSSTSKRLVKFLVRGTVNSKSHEILALRLKIRSHAMVLMQHVPGHHFYTYGEKKSVTILSSCCRALPH